MGDRPNNGALFKVPQDKRRNDSWPTYDGHFNAKCPYCERETDLFLSGWDKTTRDGGWWLSLSSKPKDPALRQQPYREPRAEQASLVEPEPEDTKPPF